MNRQWRRLDRQAQRHIFKSLTRIDHTELSALETSVYLATVNPSKVDLGYSVTKGTRSQREDQASNNVRESKLTRGV